MALLSYSKLTMLSQVEALNNLSILYDIYDWGSLFCCIPTVLHSSSVRILDEPKSISSQNNHTFVADYRRNVFFAGNHKFMGEESTGGMEFRRGSAAHGR
jgi:hypothetical protein